MSDELITSKAQDANQEPQSFTKSTEKAHYDNMKGLPIRMRDRRKLYEDLQEIYDFERTVEDEPPQPKVIFCFRLRLFFLTFWDALRTYEMWQSSLREIEIERGTLIANVFYFIKSTMIFNFSLVIIVVMGIIIPHHIVWRGFPPKISRHDKAVCRDYSEDVEPNASLSLPPLYIAKCCSILEKNFSEYEHLDGHRGIWVYLTHAPFYGYYKSFLTDSGPLLAFLYLITVVVVLLYSYWDLVRSVASGVVEIVRNKDGDVTVFSELIFCGYHHRTLTEEEARFRRKLWLHNLRVAIKAAKPWVLSSLYAARRHTRTRMLLITRIIVFLATLALIVLTLVCIFYIAQASLDRLKQEDERGRPGYSLVDIVKLTPYAVGPAFAVTVSNLVLPNVFIKLASVERYGTETTTFIILYRSLLVRLLSVVLALYRVFEQDVHCIQLEPSSCGICYRSTFRGGTYNSSKIVKRGTYCWESVLARELYKIIFTELLIKTLLTFVVDPFRKMLKVVFYRVQLFRRIGTLRFNVIRHSLDIINIQVMAWMGFYFAPGYPFAVCLYLFVIFYVKKFAVLRNCTGVPEAYKVARTTLIFTSGKVAGFVLVLFFLVVTLGLLQPSRGCGPFGPFNASYDALGYLKIFWSSHTYRPVLQTMHIVVATWHVLIISLCITILHFYFYRKKYNNYQAESVKELIYLENEDKQYLATKLTVLRTREMGQDYYNPYSVFDTEKRMVDPSNQKTNLDSQWRALRSAILPPGATKIKRKSIDMRQVASMLNKAAVQQKDGINKATVPANPGNVVNAQSQNKAPAEGGGGSMPLSTMSQQPQSTNAGTQQQLKPNQFVISPAVGANTLQVPGPTRPSLVELSEDDTASTMSKPRAGMPHKIFQDHPPGNAK